MDSLYDKIMKDEKDGKCFVTSSSFSKFSYTENMVDNHISKIKLIIKHIIL
jgi:hypothetical protein